MNLRISGSLSIGLLFVLNQAWAQGFSARDISNDPVGPSPYDVVQGWLQPFAKPGFAFGGNSGVFAQSPDRIFVAQRGETLLPFPVPEEFHLSVSSIGINALINADLRHWQNCIFVVDGEGNVIEVWDQWDFFCAASDGPGPHRVRISPYDPEQKVWVINESTHQIYVLSNDGSRLEKVLGEQNVPGHDENHFGRPQDVGFLPDGRVLIADGLDNHRVVVLDSELNYLTEFGSFGTGPGQFNGIHSLAVGPGGRVFATDRSNGRVNVFRTTDDPQVFRFDTAYEGLTIPLDMVVNDDGLWVTDLVPLRVIKYDFDGNLDYVWLIPDEVPNGTLEAHSISVDSDGNLYFGDNQYGRSQKLVPKPGANPDIVIQPPWVAF